MPWLFRAEECKMFDGEESDYVRLYQLYGSSPGQLSNYMNGGGNTFGIAFSFVLHTRLYTICIDRYVLDYNGKMNNFTALAKLKEQLW